MPLGKKGEQFRIIDNETMLEIETVRLEEHQMLNGDYQYMKFDRPVTEWKESFVVENTDYVPDVLVEGCTFQNNRARGLLLTRCGDVLVRKNCIKTAGSAILIEGDPIIGLSLEPQDISLWNRISLSTVHMYLTGETHQSGITKCKEICARTTLS